MRIRSNLRGTKGFIVAWERLIRFQYMISNKAKERCRILAFWEKYGTAATIEAFGVSRATLFRWQHALKARQGKLEGLNAQSTAPKRRRHRAIPDAVRNLIVTERLFDPHLGKEKLATLIKEDKLGVYSASTVGRMLKDLKHQGVLPDPRPLSFHGTTGTHHERQKSRRKKKRSHHHKGALAKADTVVRFIDGLKRYLVTGIDTETKFAFAYAYTSHSSKAAADFMCLFKKVAPIAITHVQTDNGSEFACHFEATLDAHGIEHFHTYPRSPKQNAEIERFNRTLWEAFARYRKTTLAHDLRAFNRDLMDWLLWYNTRRPHQTLGQVAPMRYICNQLPEEESQMWWTSI
jgi:transposase InsO family protein